MSLLVSDAISNMTLELNTITGQAIDDTDFILFLNKANEYFATNYKMPTTERQSDFLMFNGVNEYPLPSDFAGIIEPKKPYGQWSPVFQHQTTKSFVHWPYGYATSFKFDRENIYLVANCPDGASTSLNGCDSLTENGTWAVSGDGSALALDTQIFESGTGSLRFTVTASGGTTTLTCTDMAYPVDMTDFLTQWAFLDLQCPSTNTASLTSVRLRIGSDSSNYYEVTATTRYRGDSINGGWGLIGFDLSTKTTTGTPVVTAIDYAQVLLTTGVTGINGTYRLDNLFLAESVYFQLPFYSKNNIKSTTGTYKSAITATTDTILCPDGPEFASAITYKCLEIINAMRFKDGFMASYCASQLQPREAYLKVKFRKQEAAASSTWYKRALNF